MTFPIQKCVKTVLVLLLFAAPVFALNPTADQWAPLPKFSGGINTQFDRANLTEGQLIAATNFIWRDDQLQGREGFYRFAAPLSARPVEFMDIFKSATGAKYLMYSDGVDLWYRPDLTGTSTALSFGRQNRGIVDTWGTVVGGDSIAVQRFRTIFGTGEGLTMTIDGVDYTVSKILLDTLAVLTTSAGTLTDKSYNIDYSATSIQSRIVVSDNYWIYANTGKSYFNRPDSFVVVDSLAGLRFQYSATSRRCSVSPSLLFSASGVTQNYAGRFLRITTNPFSAGGAKNPVTGGHPYYMSYPIRTSGSNQVSTYSAAFQPDSTVAQYFTVEQLAYDSTTKTIYVVDSIRLFTADSTNLSCSGTEALYAKVYKASFDSTTFITGDWFFSPGYAWSNGVLSYAGSEIFTSPTEVFPVVGGFEGTDGSILVSCPPFIGSRNNWATFDKTTPVTGIFYRMKKDVSGQRAGGYIFSVLHNERVFEVRSDEPDRFYYSEPFLPDSFLAGSVTIVDQANPCVIAAKQWSDLVIYTTAGSWRVIADATAENYGTEKLNTSRGCVSRGSFLSIDNIHYGLSADGFWECDGNEPQLISDAVSTYFLDSLNQNEYAKVRSGYDAENDNIWISFPRVGSTKNSITLVYHRSTKSWWRQSFVAGSYAYNPDAAISDSIRFMVGGVDSSAIYVRGGRLDDGAAITASIQTPYLNFGDAVLGKRLKSLMIGYDSEVAAAVSIFGYRDFGLTPFDTTTFTTDAVWAQKWLRVKDAKYRGNNISLLFSIANASKIKVSHLSLQIMPLGEEQ